MADSANPNINGGNGEVNARLVTETINMIAGMNSSLPASFLQGNLGQNANQMKLGVRDPQTNKIDWILPNYGHFPLSHILSFQSVVSSGAKVYRQYDEAIKNSLDNARYMRNDCGIMECLEARQRCVALLDYHLEPEDEKSASQKELCTNLTKILERIRRFTEYRRVLLEAVWYGRYAIQHQFGWENIGGHMRLMPKPQYEGQYGWLPINGDKLCFRFNDGYMPEGGYEGQMGIRVGMGRASGELIRDKWKIEPTERGMAYFIDEDERRQVIVHKHMIEDAPFEDSLGAGSIHGVGVRSRIYWEWVQKQETLAFLMEYLERCAGGIQLWKFPQGNEKAKNAAEKAAQEFTGGSRNVLVVPIPAGDEFGQYGVEIIEPGMAGIDMLKDILTSYFGHRIKRYILGQVLSSEAEATGLGSGVAELHMDTLLQIIKYDAINLEETITFELLNRIKEWNFPEARNIHVRFKIDTESPDVEKKLEAWSRAYEIGCRLREKDVMELIGAAIPGKDDRVLDKSQQQAQEQQQQPGGGVFQGANFPPQQHAGGPTDDHAATTDPGNDQGNNPQPVPQPTQPPAVDDEPVEGRGGPRDRFSAKEDQPRQPAGTPKGGQFALKNSTSKHADAVSSLHAITGVRGSDQAEEKARTFIGNPIVNLETGMTATVSNSSLGKMLSKSARDKSINLTSHLTAVANADVLFSHAILRVSRPDRKGDRNIKMIHHFDVPMPHDGDVLRVKILVKELSDESQGSRLYELSSVKIEEAHVNRVDDPNELGGSIPPVGLSRKFIDLANEIKNKIQQTVADSGEPEKYSRQNRRTVADRFSFAFSQARN